MDAPLRLVLQVSAPPRCIIKPSGTSVSVSAFLNISLVPPGRPAVQLSSMAMVSGGAGQEGCVWPGLPVQPPQCAREECFPPGLGRLLCPKAEGEQEEQPAWPAACSGHSRAMIQPSLSSGNEAERQGVSAREGAARAAGPATVWPVLGSCAGCREGSLHASLMAAFSHAGFASTPSSLRWSR